MTAPPTRLRERARVGLSRAFFHGLSRAARWHPQADLARHGVEVERDLAYGAERAHRLDVYRPTHRPGPWPVVFYVHGGAFRMLSKDTHWLMGLVFARHGYLVVNVDYRLAPAHAYPTPLADVCAAYRWLGEHAASLGGDPTRIALAGESAGGNLVTALAVALGARREPTWASEMLRGAPAARALLPFCGMLEVSDPERRRQRRPLPRLVYSTLVDTSRAYLGGAQGDLALADPLRVIESEAPLDLPPVFAAVGTRDPLLDDTRRLARALVRRGVAHEARYYPGGVHAFHAFVWQPRARACWRDALAFLDRHLVRGEEMAPARAALYSEP